MTGTKPTVVEAQMLIRRPVAAVYAAFIDPAITSRFWFSKGSARLEAGKQVVWQWEMYGASATVEVKALELEKRILVEWGGPAAPTTIEWLFEARGPDHTQVTVRNAGFAGSAEEIVAKAIDAMGGFSLLLGGAKIFLEHGIAPRFVVDHMPQHHRPGWKEPS